MRVERKLYLAGVWGVMLALAPSVSAQSATAQKPHCFNIHVQLNGKALEAPRVITLKADGNEKKLSLEGGCFKVPPEVLSEKSVGISFEVPGNRIDLFRISGDFLAYPWDVELADKKFRRDISLPKHTRASKACVVVFHAGEPESQMVQTPCRTLLPGR